MPLHVRNAQCANTTRLVHTARLVNLESGRGRMLTVHIQRRLHARIRHDTEASRILWSRTCPCRNHQNDGKQNAGRLQSQFLRHANFKHVDRFCSLKQLELDESPASAGCSKGRKRICKYVVPPVAAIAECISRSTWWEGSRETQPGAGAGRKRMGQLC